MAATVLNATVLNAHNDIFKTISNNNFDEFMRLLNQPDFDPNIRNIDFFKPRKHQTVLMICVIRSKANGEKYVIELLKNSDIDLDLQDDDGVTALQYASKHSNKSSTNETVRLLIAAGADLDLQNNFGWTALSKAAYHSKTESNEETVSILITAGADLNLQSKIGNTALMVAGTAKAVRLLIAAGANPNIQNHKNKIAIELTNDILLQLLLVKAGSIIPYVNPRLKELIEHKIQELKAKIIRYKKSINYR